MHQVQFAGPAGGAMRAGVLKTFGFIQGGYSNLDALAGMAGRLGTLFGTFTARVVEGMPIEPTDLLAFTVQLSVGASTFGGEARPKTFRYVPDRAASLAFSAELSIGCIIRVGTGALPSMASVTGWLGRLGGWTAAPVQTMELNDRSDLLAA